MRWLVPHVAPRLRGEPTTVFARIEALSMPDLNSGCVLWLGMVDKDGYAMIQGDGRRCRVSHLLFERKHGSIPAGMVVDHTCNSRWCANEDHFAAITQLENVRRQERVAGNRCKRGHDLADGRLIDGRRICRKCTNYRARLYNKGKSVRG